MNIDCKNKEKADIELRDYIDSLLNMKGKTYIERMDMLLKFKREKRGLIGLRMTLNPSAENLTNDDIAHDLLLLERACANGDYEDVTNEPL